MNSAESGGLNFGIDARGAVPSSEAAAFPTGSVLFLISIFYINFAARVILSPLLVSVEKDLHLSHGQAGGLFFMISLGFSVAILGCGFLFSVISNRHMILLSTVAAGVGLLAAAFSSSLGWLKLWMFVVGTAGGIYVPAGLAYLTDLVPSRHWGKAFAMQELGPTLGFVTAPLLAEIFLRGWNWRALLALLGASSLLLGGIFVRYGRGGNFFSASLTLGSARTFFTQPSFWLITLIFTAGIGACSGIYSMLPLYLVSERGLDRGLANAYTAFSRISTFPMLIGAGWLVDRLGWRKALIIILLGTGILTVLLGAAPDFWLVAVVFLQSPLASCFFPPGFAAISRLTSPATRNLSIAFLMPIASLLGMGAVPAGIGYLGETASFALSLIIMGGFVIVGSFLTLSLKMFRS